VSLQDSSSVVLVTENAKLQESRNGLLVASKVEADTINTTILLTRNVEGNVETVLDTPRALLAGLTAGVAVGLVLFVGQLLTKRDK